MAKKNLEGTGSSNEKEVFLKQTEEFFGNGEMLQDIFKGDMKGLNEIMQMMKTNKLAATAALLEKAALHYAGNEEKLTAIKPFAIQAQNILQKEVDRLKKTVATKTTKKEDPTVVAKTSVETPVVVVTEEETPAVVPPEKIEEVVAEVVEEKEEEKTTTVEEQAELLRKIRIFEIAKQEGKDPSAYRKLTTTEVEALHNKFFNKEETQKKQRDVTVARKFLNGKVSRNELDALTKNPDELIAKAQELAEQTLGLKNISEVREYISNRSDLAREVDKRLTPEKIKEVQNILERKDLPIKTHEKPDLDSRIALLFVQLVGEAKSETVDQTLPKGSTYDGPGIVLDVSGINDILEIKKDRWVSDHHFPNKWVKTSTAEIVLETLRRSGKAEKIEPWMENLVSFVNDVDNMAYPRGGKDWYKNTYSRTLLGLRDILSTESLIEFFKRGKDPYAALTEEELAQECVDKQGNSKTLAQLVEATNRLTQKSIKFVEHYERRAYLLGQKTFSAEFGKVLMYEPVSGSRNWEIPHGSHAAYNMGYDTYVRFDPVEKFYFISRPGVELKELLNRINKKDPLAKITRGSMIHSQKPKDSSGREAGLTENQIINYLGLDIRQSANIAASVEYLTRRAVTTEQRSMRTGKERIEHIREFLAQQVAQARQNIDGFTNAITETEAKRAAATKPSDIRDYEVKIKKLQNKLTALQTELKLWEDKLKTANSISGTRKQDLEVLINATELGRVDTETKETGAETLIEEAVALTPEQIKAKLEEVTQEFDTVEAKLKEPGGSVAEIRTLLLAHYNLSRLGYYLQEGAVGEQPKELTWAEFKPIFIEQEKARAGTLTKQLAAVPEETPAATFEVAPVAPRPAKVHEITLAEFADEGKQVTVEKINVTEGQYVTAGTVIAELEIDKLALEIRATADGYVSFGSLAGSLSEGTKLKGGAVFATISTEKPAASPETEVTRHQPEELFVVEPVIENETQESGSVTEISTLEMGSFVKTALLKELAETLGNDNIQELTLGTIDYFSGNAPLSLIIKGESGLTVIEGTVSAIGTGKDAFEVKITGMETATSNKLVGSLVKLTKNILGPAKNETELATIMSKDLTQSLNQLFKQSYPRVEKVKLTR